MIILAYGLENCTPENQLSIVDWEGLDEYGVIA